MYFRIFHVVCMYVHVCVYIIHHMQLATAEQKTAIFGVLGQVHISDATEEDLKAGKEDIKVSQFPNRISSIIRSRGSRS